MPLAPMCSVHSYPSGTTVGHAQPFSLGSKSSPWLIVLDWGHMCDRIPSTNPGAEPPRDARDSGSARLHSMHLETSSSDRP